MAKKTREELIQNYKDWGRFSQAWQSFYSLPHERKADLMVFSKFCCQEGGHAGILLSDDRICDDPKHVRIAKYYGFYGDYHLLSDRILSDPEMALVLADCNANEYNNIAKSLRDDPNLMLKAIKINPRIYISLPVKVKINRNILIEVAKNDPYQLFKLTSIREEYKRTVFSDIELALIVAQKSPNIINEIFNPDIKNNLAVLQTIFCLSNPKECKKRLNQYTWGLKYLDQKYWIDNKELIKKALREDGNMYNSLPQEYRTQKKIALLAVKSNPNVLKDCPDELRDDSDVVKAALQEDTEEILQFASERLRSDYDLVYKAVSVDALNLQYASTGLRDNRDIVLRAVKTYGGVLEDASERLQNDEGLKRIADRTN